MRGLFTLAQSYAVELDGDLPRNGTVVLAGEAPSASSEDGAGAFLMTQLTVQLSPATGLAGTLAYETRPEGATASYYTLMTVAGDIVSATRRDLASFSSSFDGTWKGRFVVRGCTPNGSLYCYPRDERELAIVELTLTQNGDQASGTLVLTPYRIPVTGRVSGDSLVLNGEVLTSSSGGSSLTRIVTWTSTRDGLGRMVGTFDYMFTWPAEGAPRLGSSAHAELWQVVKIP